MMYHTICTMCAHFGATDDPENPDLVSCTAFPAGIPDEILTQAYDHRNPFEGDNGVLFTPDGPVDVDAIEDLVNPKVSRNPRDW